MAINKSFGTIFLVVGLILQVVTYILSGDEFLSFVSGLCGVISVVLCSQRKMMFYLFGFVQLFTYVWLCYNQHLWAEIAENAFYFITMLYGLFHWYVNYNDSEKQVETRNLSGVGSSSVFLSMIVFTMFLYAALRETNDTQPFMDAVTTVPAFIAQTLMILRYRESWIYWFIIDIGSIIMWAVADNWCMVAQFVFWTANCLYGFLNWKKQ